jgi:hypothetical protein
VLAARRNEIDVRTQALQLEMDTARVWAQLNFLHPADASASNANAGASTRPAPPASAQEPQ